MTKKIGLSPFAAASLILIALQFAPAPLRAQATTATILGVAKDSSGAVLPGAAIAAANVGTGATRSVTTDSQGRFSLPDLALGNYELRASLTGFKAFVQSGITLVVGQQAVINVVMQVGNVSEQVTVTSEAPLVETSNSQIGGFVNGTQVRQLPLNGRSFDQLALLQVGVQAFRQVQTTPNTSFSTRMTVSGARIDANNTIVDGIEINDWARSGGGSAAGLFLGVDAVQEFKVLTHNYPAEYGRNAGAEITVVTRSGTNSLHGSAFEFIRNDKLDARNFFDLDKSSLKRNQFGVYLAGPVKRDRIFFAANYEGYRERRGTPFTNFVLTDSARRGVLPTGQITVAPSVIPYLATNVMPLPNAGILTGGVTGKYVFQFRKPTNEDFGMGRIDYRISDKDSLFLRYTVDYSSSLDPDQTGATPFFGAGEDFAQQNAVVQHTRIFSPTFLNVLRVGFKRSTPKSLNYADPNFPGQQLTFVPGVPFGKITFSTATNTFGAGASTALTPFGQAALTPGYWFTTAPQFIEQAIYTRGAHSLKLGLEFEPMRDSVNNGLVAGGTYTFTSIQNFLTAVPATFTAPLPGRDNSNDHVQKYFAWYVSDDIRATSRLTLNVGLRHEFVTAPRDRREGRTVTFVDVAHDADVSQVPSFFKIGKNNFAPRVGLAWDVTGDGKTSVRSGFGMYYNQWIGRDFGIFVQQAPSVRNALTVQTPAQVVRFPNEYSLLQAAGFPVATVRPGGSGQQGAMIQYDGVDTPTMIQYSLEIERQIVSTGTVKIGYIGSHGYHLLSNNQANPRVPSFLPDGTMFFPATNPLRNPRINQVVQRGSEAASSYNSLQMEFRMRPSHGLELQTNYVFSKSLDNLSSNAGADSRGAPTQFENPFDHSRDRGLSDFDSRHTFSTNFLYQIPSKADATRLAGILMNGWSAGGILSASAGNPFTPLVGFCQSNITLGCGADRPNLPSGKAPKGTGDPNHYFDPTPFTLPANGFFGNAGRNIMTGPRSFDLDFSVFKQFKLSESKSLQFRAEAFNILNHVNFGLPVGNLFTSGGARQENTGIITQTLIRSREIQFGLKMNF